jgi:AcrR family transcriptional regulator
LTADETEEEQRPLLQNVLSAFLTFGFHAIPLSELEAATGCAWNILSARYGDKEALFLAAAKQGLADGTVDSLGKQAEVLEMLSRLERVNGNPRLRAIHKQPLTKVRTIAQGKRNPEASKRAGD